MLEGEMERHVPAGDGGRTRAAVGLYDVAVDLDLPLAETREVRHRAERAADQALDLLRAAGAGGAGAVHAAVGRARQHAVLARHPAAAAVAQEGRHRILDARRDRKSTRLNSSHDCASRMPAS